MPGAGGAAVRIQVLGICRFSLLVEGGFQIGHETLDDRRRMLYDPDRLAQRFHWFEQVCLPAMAAQTDRDFRLIVLTGTDFPRPWLDRLRDDIAGVPQIVLEQRAPGVHRDLCRAVIAGHIDPRADVVAQFRKDDDDAVAVDYVARLRSDFTEKLQPMFAAHPLLSVDHSRAFVLSTRGSDVEVEPMMSRNLVALAIFMPPDHRRCVLDYGHHKLISFMPGVTFQDAVMSVRGKHETNDGRGPLREGLGWAIDPAKVPGILQRRFRIDLDAFRAGVAATGGTSPPQR